MNLRFEIGELVYNGASTEVFRYSVIEMVNCDRPKFPNHPDDGCVNYQLFEEREFEHLLHANGLVTLFQDPARGLTPQRPSVRTVATCHLFHVDKAAVERRLLTGVQPGYSIPGDGTLYDPVLAFLEWTRWWLAWAIENCECPSIVLRGITT